MTEMYGSYSDEDLNEWERMPQNIRVLTSSAFGAWLLRRDKNMKEPKIGYWFIDERPESDREVICSNCEQPVFKYHKMDFDYRPKFCPNCGAKMEE